MTFRVISETPPVDRSDLYVSKTSKVREEDYDAICYGIVKACAEVRSALNLVNVGNFDFHKGEYGNANWYQKQAGLLNGQVDINKFLNLLDSEPYQEQNPHKDFCVVDKDLTVPEKTNFVYGVQRGGNMILSTNRFQNLSQDVRDRVLKFLAAHEMGHNFGLVKRDHNYRFILGGHCNGEQGPCLMEQVNVDGCRDVVEQSHLVIPRDNWLCSDCLEEVVKYREESRITF